MTGLKRDLRDALRFLGGRRGWTAVAVLSLALGIGANTVVFSVVESVLLRPFPYTRPDEVVLVSGSRTLGEGEALSIPDLQDIRSQSTTLASIAWYQPSSPQSPGIEPAVPAGRVGAGVFEVLGVGTFVGRTFTEADEGTDRVILSYGFWQSRYGGDPSVVGRSMNVNGEPYEIIGVMPPGFFFPEPGVEFWVPIGPSERLRTAREFSSFRAVARRAPDTPLETARAEMALLGRRLDAEYPRDEPFVVGLFPVSEAVVANFRLVLGMLEGAAALVLLIACVNVANLLLARGTSRQKELALRATLGANRLILIRQLLAESMLLAIAGGLVAIGLAYAGIRSLLGVGLMDIPRLGNAEMNSTVLLAALGISILTGALSGALPALRASKVDLTSSLKTGTQTPSASGSRRLQDVLVGSQIAVALTLLIGAGLLVRSSLELGRIDWGFDPAGAAVLATRPSFSFGTDGDSMARRLQITEAALGRIRQLPGVDFASAGVAAPLTQTGLGLGERVVPEGGPVSGAIIANRFFVTPDYFRSLGIEIEGREFDETDIAGSRRSVVLSAGLATDLFPDEDPIGQTIHLASPIRENDDRPRGITISFGTGQIGTLTINGGQARGFEVTGETAHTVIGIANDVRMSDDVAAGSPQPTLYADFRQAAQIGLESDIILGLLTNPSTFVLRSDSMSQGLIDQVRAILVELNPDLSFFVAAPLEDLVSRAIGGTGSSRLMQVLGVVFGVIALVLASVGVYGVMSYAVAQRTWEIGIRMAVGASSGRILRMILTRAAVLSAVGLALGLAGAWAASRLLEGTLFGIDTTDPATYIAVTLVLFAVVIGASIVPARRASRVDPLTATRMD